MRARWSLVIVLLATFTVPAGADPSARSFDAWASALGAPGAQEAPAPGPRSSGQARSEHEVVEPRFALGVNAPTGWLRHNLGASLQVGVGRHHAIRAGVAWYDAEELLPLVLASFESAPRTGNILDLGLGWVWYPRRLGDGVMLEVGALRRERDVAVRPEFGDKERTRSLTHAARATAGWSWLFGGRVFVAAALGFSVGHESGEVTSSTESTMAVTTPISRLQVAPEVYVRFGLAFGR